MAINICEVKGVRDWVIYKVTNPKSKVYIGVTSNMRKRITKYKSDAKLNKKLSQSLIVNSLIKYGVENHKFDIIDKFTSGVKFALEKEVFWIDFFMSNVCKHREMNGLNLTDGGQGTIGFRPTKEQRKARSEKCKGVKRDLTDEQRNEISKRSKGNKYRLGSKWNNPERMRKHILWLKEAKIRKGHKCSDEDKEKKSIALRKKILVYDLMGCFIKEYLGVKEAAKDLGITTHTIRNFIVGRIKTPSKYKFVMKQKNT